MYKKILVPLDGSKRAERILNHVETIALVHHSRVVFLRVVNWVIVADGYKSVSLEGIEEQNRRSTGEALVYLSAVEGEFRQKGIPVQKICESGPVVETILKVAQRENVDLVAMASHGRTGLARVFYGSVAAGILQCIDRPLLLVRSRNL